MQISISNTIRGFLYNGGVTPPSFSFLLDTYPDASVAYSLRKLRSAYSGSAIRVRRSSDNTETNIGFIGNQLDITSLLTFCGAGNGFVTTWYDQSGNGNNAVQSTATSQPTIVLNGVIYFWNGFPTMFFNGSGISNDLSFTGIVADTNTSTYLVGRALSATISGPMIGHSEFTSGMVVGQFNNTSYILISKVNGVLVYANTAANSLDISFCIQNVYITTNIFPYKNNTSIPIIPQPTFTPGQLTFNNIGRYSNYIATHGYISEAIIYKSNQLTNRIGINTNINTFYNVFWQGTGTALLDLYPSATVAYSLRNLSSTYFGPLVRVRRSSDNTEQDFYGLYNGQLDTASLLAFCGVGNGFVTKWYDQSGNGKDVLQVAATVQPKIVSSGVVENINTKPAILADGVDDILYNTSNPYIIPVLYSLFAVANKGVQTTDTSTTPRPFFAGTDGGTNGVPYLGTAYSGNANQNKYFVGIVGGGTVINSVDWNNGVTILAYNKMNGGSGAVVGLNGNSSTGTLANIQQAGNSVCIFGNFNISQRRFSGKIPELILYPSDQTTNRTLIESNINSYYNIY